MAKILPNWVRNEDGTSSKVLETKKSSEPKPIVDEPERSIDELLNRGLMSIGRTMVTLTGMINAGNVDREVIGCLKDCMTMLHELKKKEKELLEGLSDEELDKLLKETK